MPAVYFRVRSFPKYRTLMQENSTISLETAAFCTVWLARGRVILGGDGCRFCGRKPLFPAISY